MGRRAIAGFRALATALALAADRAAGWIGRDLLGYRVSPVSGVPIAIFLGIVLCNSFGVPDLFQSGLRACMRPLQRLAIMLLGFRPSLAAVGSIGLNALPTVVLSITVALIFIPWLARKVGLSNRLGTLIAVGTSICGVSAIMAVAPTIEAEEEEVSYAVACVAIFGMLAMLVYPYAVSLLFGSDYAATGVFLGTAIHDTAQVTGAALVFQQSHQAPEVLNTATVVKILSNLSMIVVIPLMAAMFHRTQPAKSTSRVPLHQVLPAFVLGFLALTIVRSIGDASARPFGFLERAQWVQFLHAMDRASTWFLAVVMAAVGLSTGLAQLRRLGLRPFFVGLSAALIMGAVSFLLIRGAPPSASNRKPGNPMSALSHRRQFIKSAGVLATTAAVWPRSWAGESTITLPFENGERELIAYPQKRPLIRLTTRPPQLETPFAVFNEGLITPNDAFFVRYHLADIPTHLDPQTYRLRVHGAVKTPLELSLADLKNSFRPVDVIAVNQCSGNSRGHFSPRVAGGQLSHGAMGNARWTGVPLKQVLEKAGLTARARQVAFDGLDRPVVPATPDFVKALEVDHALDGEVMLAFAMNGEDLPMLNGYPLRLVVPGYYGTYWIKHVSDIEVLEAAYAGFWMSTAYRAPNNPTHSVLPGETPKETAPISRFAIRSFITSLPDGAGIPVGRDTVVRGIAFDSGQGIRQIAFSADGGQTWRDAELGADLGRYSFREWKISFGPSLPGPAVALARAFNRAGESQPLEPLWNPAGYMRNVVERVRYTAV